MLKEAQNMDTYRIDCSLNQQHVNKHAIGICSVCGDGIH